MLNLMWFMIFRWSERSKPSFEPTDWPHEISSQASDSVSDMRQLNDRSRNGKTAVSGSLAAVQLQDQMKWLKQHDMKKVYLSVTLSKAIK